ncbi:MAG: acetate kinase [Candidatus Ratteibacteria bacterium]|jgi:acetate kinase
MLILTLNCGSSSVKYLLYDWKQKRPVAKGMVERVTVGGSYITHEITNLKPITIKRECGDHRTAIALIMEVLQHPEFGVIKDLSEIVAVGHRVVHGGERFTCSTRIDDEVLRVIKTTSFLAPLHNPPNISGIEGAMEVLPDVPHIAVFDTAWHQTIPEYAYIYALPYEWYQKYGVRRYGFHGTSLLYVAKRAAVLLGKDPFEVNLVSCHIGNGVSVNAVRNGLSVDTSMGFTPLEGLVMGTRPGDHDAAIDFFVMEKENLSGKEMDDILNKKSGILGITGKFTDRRDVLKAAAEGDPRCKLALAIEAYRLKKYIGAYCAALGRVDALIFTAGVGELSADIRRIVLEGLAGLSIKFDLEKNNLARSRNAEFDISAPDSGVKIFIIPTDEEMVFVEDTVAILENRYGLHTQFTYSFQAKDYVNRIRYSAFEEEVRCKPEVAGIVAMPN